MNHRKLTAGLIATALTAVISACSGGGASEPDATITVYKSPTCGCCTKWARHLEDNGFSVKLENTPDLAPVRQRFGVPDRLAACHTARVAGYVIEGHVPAQDIKRLLTERPQAKGLTVPGMPIGSPGMEIGDRKDAYDVLLFTESGDTRVFARH